MVCFRGSKNPNVSVEFQHAEVFWTHSKIQLHSAFFLILVPLLVQSMERHCSISGWEAAHRLERWCRPRHHGPQACAHQTSISGFSSQIMSTPSPQQTYRHYWGHHGKPTVCHKRCPDMCHHAHNHFISHHIARMKPKLYINSNCPLYTNSHIMSI
jgi:hypothetical protein